MSDRTSSGACWMPDTEATSSGCDIEPHAPGRQHVRKFLKAPSARDRRAYVDFLKETVRKEGVEYLFPMPEVEIGILNDERDIFGGRAKVIINEPFIIDTFSDKLETAAFFKEKGFPHPRTFLLEQVSNELPFPFLLKKRYWGGAKKVVIVHDAEELAFYRKRMDDTVAQELVGSDDEEYTVGAFSDGGTAHVIAFRRSLGYGSLSKTVELVIDRGLEKMARDIAKAISLKGSINIQLRKAQGRYVPFEINPRFSSTVYLRSYFGFRDVKWWLGMIEGKKIAYEAKFKKGVAVRTLGEAFFGMAK